MNEDPKELLKNKAGILAVELVERPGEVPRPVVTILLNEHVSEIASGARTPLAANLIAWLTLYREAIDDPDGAYIKINKQGDNFPPPEEMIEHLERSLEVMKKEWPFEYEHASSCVFDHETATFIVSPFPVPGGLNKIKNLLPEGSAGRILRCPSPVNFFRHPDETHADRPRPGIGRLVIIHPDIEDEGMDEDEEPPEVKFPEN